MKREKSFVGEDFLNAKLRGMRSRLYEEERLRPLTALPNLPELFRAVYPEETFAGRLEFERRLLGDHVRDLDRVERFLSERTLEVFSWLMVHYQLENLKVLLRAFLAKEPRERAEALLAPVPPGLELPLDKLFEAPDLHGFGELLPVKEFRVVFRQLLQVQENPEPFVVEMALDHAYCLKLAKYAQGSVGWSRRLLGLDVDSRNILYVLRARFNYEYPFSDIRRYLAPSGVFLTARRAEEMAAADSLARAIERIPDSCLPADERAAAGTLRQLEDALRIRLYRMAKHCFCQAVLEQTIAFAFYYIKRAEFANLVRVTESVRQSLPREEIEAKLWR